MVELINADSLQTLGYPRAVVDGVGNLRMARYIPPSSEKVVVVNSKDEEVIGFACLADKENSIVTEVNGAVHPSYWGQGIGGSILNWAEERAKELSAGATEGVRTVVQANLFETELRAIKLFADSGYEKVREWVHMEINLDGQFSTPALPDNMTLREMDLDNDWDIVGPALDEAFADHWGTIPQGAVKEVDEDETDEDESPGDDSFSNAPSHCFIVLDGEKVAGGILCNAKLVERNDTGRVGSVFVRPKYRKCGLGQILMKTAFNAFFLKGMIRRIILDTDTQSFTQAPKFYLNLGMRPYRHEFLYEKEIRFGREVRRLTPS